VEDGLCLIRDDVEDVASGIARMHNIYCGSYFTTAAATGNDASAGLPALKRNTEAEGQTKAIVRLES
jgi:hypothetical protein